MVVVESVCLDFWVGIDELFCDLEICIGCGGFGDGIVYGLV